MPLLTNEQALADIYNIPADIGGFRPQPERVQITRDEFKAADPELSEILGAAFRRENVLISTLANAGEITVGHEYDPNYNYLDDIEGYEAFESVLALSKNAQHTSELKAQIDREKQDQDIINRSGVTGVIAQMAAGVLDPTVLLPVGGVVAQGALKAAKTTLKTSTAATAAVGVQEAGLQATQNLRSKEETIYAMAGAAILGGALGAGYSAYRKAGETNYQALKQSVTNDTTDEMITVKETLVKNGYDVEETLKQINDSVGAKRVTGKIDAVDTRQMRLADTTIKSAAGLERVLKNMTPMLSSMQSEILKSRETIQKLINVPLALEGSKDLKATAQSVESLKAQYSGRYLRTQERVLDVYKDYKKARKGVDTIPYSRDTVTEKAKLLLGKAGAQTSFLEEVGKSMRRGDKHPVKEIERAAKEYRQFFDDVFQEAIDAKIFEDFPDRKTAESYFSRVFNQDAIRDNLEEFRDIVTNYVKEQTTNQVGAIKDRFAKQKESLQNTINNLQLSEYRKPSFLGPDTKLSSSDIDASLKYLKTNKPKKPETLLKYISRQGGIDIKDPSVGNLKVGDIRNWSEENFLRVANEAEEGGLSIDELSLRAWESDFFPEYSSRPTVNEFIEAINDEAGKIKEKVRPDDADALNDFRYFNDVESSAKELKITPKDYDSLTPKQLEVIRDSVAKKSKVNSQARIAKLNNKIARLDSALDRELEDVNQMGVDIYSEEVANQIVRDIQGLNSVNPEFRLFMGNRGPLKEQKFLIPDELVEKFIVSDAQYIAERYAHNMGTDIELVNKFGTSKLDEILEPLSREYEEQLLTKTGDARKNLEKQFKRDKENITGAYDLLRGSYAGDMYGGVDSFWKKLGRTTMSYNYVRLLGGVAVSSIPDISKLVAYNGFGTFFNDALIPLTKQLPKIVKGIRPEELKELKLAGTTIEYLNNSRAMTLGDLGGIHSNMGAFEKLVNTSAKVFSKATLITSWNDTMQSFAGVMSQKRLINDINDLFSGKELGKREKEYLSILGIGKDEVKEIGEQLAQHSKKDGDFILANTENWTNRAAVKSFRAALKKDVDSMILQKEIGDMPLMANTALGRLVLQFKSFVFASTTKTLMTGLQRADKEVLQGVTSFIALGALTYIIKTLQAGKEPDYSVNNLIVQGIDRSGFLGIIMEANNIAEKVGLPGVGRLAGQAPASRYYSRSLPEALFGPTIGTVSNIGQAVYATSPFTDGQLTDSDVRNLRKLIPYNNLFYLQNVMSAAGADTAKQFGY